MKNPKIEAESLAKLTGFTSRWLRDLAKSGHIPKPVRGVYDRDETLTRLFTYLRERSSPTAMQAAKVDRAQAQARIARVAADLAEKKTVSLESVRCAWTEHGTRAKFFIYESVTQIATQAQMQLSLSSDQTSRLRAIVREHQHRAVVQIHTGELCKMECPHCHQAIECPQKNHENKK